MAQKDFLINLQTDNKTVKTGKSGKNPGQIS
jgi:hypothetical protein